MEAKNTLQEATKKSKLELVIAISIMSISVLILIVWPFYYDPLEGLVISAILTPFSAYFMFVSISILRHKKIKGLIIYLIIMLPLIIVWGGWSVFFMLMAFLFGLLFLSIFTTMSLIASVLAIVVIIIYLVKSEKNRRNIYDKKQTN